MKKNFNLKIGGPAGEGIKVSGLILSKCLMRSGFQTFDYTEYPSLIRGGHNTYQIHASLESVYSQIKKLDILLALDQKTILLHQKELETTSLTLYDSEKIKSLPDNLVGHYLPIPFTQLALENGGKAIMANNVALGAVIFFLNLNLEILKGIIAEIFKAKGEETIKQNQKALESGFFYSQQHFSQFKFKTKPPELKSKTKKILLSGNEAVALGAISAGMKFYAAYPMTPTTGILHYLASKAKSYSLLVKHAEDEISVINLALGASFAGVRSMVGTSGGGFSLMTEALGMAGMMELPLVIVEGMRTGPSTGMPTWHDQADLLFVIFASQGEFPRLVLAPGDIEECFYLTQKAFYFAEKYQLPVIILIDKYLAESAATLDSPPSLYKNQRYSLVSLPIKNKFYRYAESPSGISLRSLPGWQNGEYLSNSYEHDQAGFATEEIEKRKIMVEKRLKKIKTLSQEINQLKQFQLSFQAKVGVISWGSNKGPILQALAFLEDKLKFDFLNLSTLWPLPTLQLIEFIRNHSVVVDIEANATGQLAKLISQETGFIIQHKLLKYDGRPFYPEEIVDFIKNINNFK